MNNPVNITHLEGLSRPPSQVFELRGPARPFHNGAKVCLSGASGVGAGQYPYEAELEEVARWCDDNSVRAYLRRKFPYWFVCKRPNAPLTGLGSLGNVSLTTSRGTWFYSVKEFHERDLRIDTDAKWMAFPKTKDRNECVFYFKNETDAVFYKLKYG